MKVHLGYAERLLPSMVIIVSHESGDPCNTLASQQQC